MDPIDIAARGHRPRAATDRFRRATARLHAVLAAIVVVAVFVQVYLIGAYIFGAGQGALDAHRSMGFIAHGIEVSVLVAALLAWLPVRDLLLSLLLAAVGTAQIGLADAHRWVGALHPLGALVVLTIAAGLVRRARARFR
jgi:hypothetical protein